jgi:hypothetical protein
MDKVGLKPISIDMSHGPMDWAVAKDHVHEPEYLCLKDSPVSEFLNHWAACKNNVSDSVRVFPLQNSGSQSESQKESQLGFHIPISKRG